jgi:thiamine biosynthesis lipoprotein
MVDGKRYHHILDPKTGSPTRGGCISATSVVSADQTYPGALSDAFGTAAFVLGPRAGKAMLEENGYSGILVAEGKAGVLNVTLTDDLVGKTDIIP